MKAEQHPCGPSLETLINPGNLVPRDGDGVLGGTGRAGNGSWRVLQWYWPWAQLPIQLLWRVELRWRRLEAGPPFLEEPTEKLACLAERPEGAPDPVPVVEALDLTEVVGGGIPFPPAGGGAGRSAALFLLPPAWRMGLWLPRGWGMCGGNRLEASGGLGGGETLLKK